MVFVSYQSSSFSVGWICFNFKNTVSDVVIYILVPIKLTCFDKRYLVLDVLNQNGISDSLH